MCSKDGGGDVVEGGGDVVKIVTGMVARVHGHFSTSSFQITIIID